MADLTIMTTEVSVNVLPEWHNAASHTRVAVRYRGMGRWAVENDGFHLGHDGIWSHPVQPDGDWLDEHRFPSFDAALEAAKEIAPSVDVDGVTALQLFERIHAGCPHQGGTS